MSLLEDQMEKCIILNKQTKPDGYGGYESTWTEGAEFEAIIIFNTSIEARIGEKQNSISRYTVGSKSKTLNLEYNDYFRRLSDGKIFRVTSDGDDKTIPKMASVELHQVVEAEEIMSLPN